MPTNYGGFAGVAKLKGNPYGIGGFGATLPPEAYSGGVSPRYQTGVAPVGGPAFGPVQSPGSGFGYGSANDIVYDPFTGVSTNYYSTINNLPPPATNVKRGPAYLTGAEVDIGGPGPRVPSIGQNIPLNDLDVPPENADFYYSGSPDMNVRRGLPVDSSGTTDLSNAPMVTPEGYGTVGSPYPLPGGFYQPKPSFFGGLLDKLLGRNRPPPNTPTSSFDPSTGMNWVNSATNTDAFGNPVGMDASGYPLPGGGPGGPTAPNWAINASRPTQPWGFGPNYVDPREANAFFGGLANWNAGAATQGFSGAGEAGLGGLGRGPVTAKGLAQAAFLRGGGGGAVQGMAGKIK